MAKHLYIIKGTGLALDGQVVNVVGDGEGDYVVVSPPNTYSGVENTMVKRACLQEIADTPTHFYRVIVQKWETDNPMSISQLEIDLPNCIRNVKLDTIADYLETNLRPILRME